MMLTIEHSQTKRQIDGAFNLCGSRADLGTYTDPKAEECAKLIRALKEPK